MHVHNRIIHGLWIGNSLSTLERLTILSFLEHGHSFHLWCYEDVDNVPDGTVLRDANLILSADHVFQYKYVDPNFDVGKGSYAGFSDIFRYKLLYQEGGWWSDMDVTCLHPLDFPEPYVFRDHNETLSVVGNIMKCPAGSQLMLDCYDQASREVDEFNDDWAKPVRILCDAIEKHDLGQFIVKGLAPSDGWQTIQSLLLSNGSVPPNAYVIHWCNELWRCRGIDKLTVPHGSTYAGLLGRFGIYDNQPA